MAQDYKVISKFGGYRSKVDETKLDGGYLVSGSQNVEVTDSQTVRIRDGYTLFGAANSSLTPIESSYEWRTHRGVEQALRSYDNKLEYYDTNDSAWVELLLDSGSSFTAVDFNFAEYWEAVTESQDLLLFVNGTSNIYMWSGGTTTFASATSNTITKEGSTTWGEEGFLTGGTRKVVIDGTTYTYTGGEGTTTLTGVTPDPTVSGHSAGASVAQAIRTTPNSGVTGLPNAFANDLISALNNQIFIGSKTSREVYMSNNTTYLDFSFSAPRSPGEGAILTFDQTTVGFVVQEQFMYVSSGQDFWYKIAFQTSDDLLTETLAVLRLKTASQQGAKSQSAIGKMKNYVMFISNEPTLDSLGRIQNIDTPQAKPISDPIKKDFNKYDFTNAHIKYYKNDLYIALPVESVLLKYNLDSGAWEAPWILPAGRLAIIGGELYLHSNSVPETYKLFDGTNDNGKSINAIARFAYQNFGTRVNLKRHDEWYTEGYIAGNTTLTAKLFYDYKGSTQTTVKEIDGSDDNRYVFLNPSRASLGKDELGKEKIGGTSSSDELNKFRAIYEQPLEDYYEIQPEYSSNDIDYKWEVLAFGGNIKVSPTDNNYIKVGD